MKYTSLLAITAALATAACDDGPTVPAVTTVAISATPTSGTLVVPAAFQYFEFGGVALPKGSGLISARVTLASARQESLARLSVFLMTDGQTYCGHNDNDLPRWAPLGEGFTTTYEVTGFRVYRLPCDVTGIRAVLHTHPENGSTEPRPGEILAQATVPVRFRIQQ